jgi:hypothetical protein
MRVLTHHHHDIRSDAWGDIVASYFLRTRTKAENMLGNFSSYLFTAQ